MPECYWSQGQACFGDADTRAVPILSVTAIVRSLEITHLESKVTIQLLVSAFAIVTKVNTPPKRVTKRVWTFVSRSGFLSWLRKREAFYAQFTCV
jgi:hypothetical protein